MYEHSVANLNQPEYFNEEILRSLFVLQIKPLRDDVKWRRVHRNFSLLHIQGFFGKRTLLVEEHRIARKALLRVAGFDPYELITNTCFSYRPGQQCLTTAVGSSRARCKAHDLMDTMICAIGSYEVFVYGQDVDEGFTGAAPKDIRYWSLLLACYWNDHVQVREQLQDMIADPSFEGKVASTICDCFMVATRRNYPSLINLLHEEVKEREDVLEKLGKRSSEFNVLVESIRMQYSDVFETLLKWKWRFVHDSWSYMRFMTYILDTKMEAFQRETLFRIMLTWTDTWRNISEMKSLLQKIGGKQNKRLLEILIEVLKSQHFYRHERGVEGSFDDTTPLKEFCTPSGDIDMLQMFLENRNLMLPHTTDAKDMEMRRLVIYDEMQSRPRMNVPRLKLLVEHSQDLIDEKAKLQSIMCQTTMGKKGRFHEWSWLAKKVGLKSTYDDGSSQGAIFGSVLLALAAGKLDVDAVRFLTENGSKLAQEASTFQVYEDDEDAMSRLDTVRELLARGGQGEYKERRVFETTFMPVKTSVARKPFYAQLTTKSKKADTTTALEATKAASAAYSPVSACPRFLRSMSNATQKMSPKSHKSRKATTSISTTDSSSPRRS